ncbi:MAG TPA: HEAT repeat domain-containing protein [Anaerolineales bacterium]|nr:HEAT repeat domain-containing protein [Anaerolineales bacterium]
MEESPEKQIDLKVVLEALLDTPTPFPPKYLYRLTDLAGEELNQLKNIWLKVDPLRRKRLLEDLEMLAEANFILLFDPVYKLALTDPDQTARRTAIRALWESNDKDVGNSLLKILNDDSESVPVKAQAAAGLGKFIYLGEFEEIPQSLHQEVLDALLEKARENNPEIIRQRAIEALGFSSSPKVADLIESAYQKNDDDWTITALIAMGRSCLRQWTPMVIESLNHEDSQVRLEAVQAASEIKDQETAEHLLQLIDDPDDEVREAAIWALSEIGGDDAKLALETALMATNDEEEIHYLEEALDNLDFNEMEFGFELLDLSEEDLEGMISEDPDELDSLEDEE